jgi:hypothetical protein
MGIQGSVAWPPKSGPPELRIARNRFGEASLKRGVATGVDLIGSDAGSVGGRPVGVGRGHPQGRTPPIGGAAASSVGGFGEIGETEGVARKAVR